MKNFELIFIAILFSAILINAQSKSQIKNFYEQKNFEKVIEEARKLKNIDEAENEIQFMIGHSFVETQDFINAIPYLEKYLISDKTNDDDKPKALLNISKAFYATGKYKDSKNALIEIEKFKSDQKINSEKEKLMMIFGFSDFYKNWKVVVNSDFIFHIENSELKIDSSENRFEKFYKNLFSFLNYKTQKRIDLFLWNESKNSSESSEFIYPEYNIIHSSFSGNTNYLIAKNYLLNNPNTIIPNSFIIEGASLYFSNEIFELPKINFDVKNLWQKWNSYPENEAKIIAANFVKNLIERGGKENFLELLKDQSFENAQKVYGRNLENIINEIKE